MQQPLKTFLHSMTPSAIASAVLHAIVLALLVFGLPQWTMEPEEPDAIQVQLVQPEDEVSEQEEPPAEQPDEPAPEEQASAAADQPAALPIPTLRPVYQFGEEDSGPLESEAGTDPSGTETAETQPSEAIAEDSRDQDQSIDVLESAAGEAVAAPVTEEEPREAAETSEAALSLHNTENPVATTAIDGLSRGVRAGELCASELRRQLLGSPYPPNLLPTYKLDEGTVLLVHKGAFRSNAGWFNLQFRCEIDEAATRVLEFDYQVGSLVPREEWAARGFPDS